MKLITPEDYPDILARSRQPYMDKYLSMYSTLLGGIVTDPTLMQLPLDDHLVHRGDGVFEVFYCIKGSMFNLTAHMERLERSAETLRITIPFSRPDLIELIKQTIRAGGQQDSLIRLFLSRGPGSFGVNPYDCPEPQIYIVISRPGADFMDTHPGGARVMTSSIPVKPSMFATIKSCNYLPNVMMKLEAVDAGMDFAIGKDENGFLAEGATENFGILTTGNELLFPDLGRVLRGTSMVRVSELANQMVDEGVLNDVRFTHVSEEDAYKAAECYILGTTPGIAPIVEFNGRRIGNGKPGPIYQAIKNRLVKDAHENEAYRTPVWD
jgi:branched-chain amino acid aminotransferase